MIAARALTLNSLPPDLRAGGGTALYAGLVEGVRMLQSARHRKKVLLLVTDGNNTSRRASSREARRAVQRSEALIFVRR